MDNNKIDLHTHSKFSDGTLPPTQLVDLAAQSGIEILALTDHDTTEGIYEAAERAKAKGITFIPGIELQIEYAYGQLHLLGLNLQSPAIIEDALVKIRSDREVRNKQIINLLREEGFPISYDELITTSGGGVTGRLHIANLMAKKKYVSNYRNAFDHYIGEGKSCYVKRRSFDIVEAITLIHKAEGVAVVAHPLTLKMTSKKLSEQLKEWKKKGLDGIEAYHSGATVRQAQRLFKIARMHDLGVTGGSDYHGISALNRTLGICAGGRPAPKRCKEFIDNLLLETTMNKD